MNQHTGFSANMMMLGRNIWKPIDILSGVTVANQEETPYADYVRALHEQLLLVHKTAREHLHSAQERQKKDYDLRLRNPSSRKGI